MFANDAQNEQSGGEQRDKGNKLAGLGFEKVEKITRFHIRLWVDGWDGRSEHW